MRNLKLVESVQVGDVTALVGAQCICVDYDTKAVYCATANGMSMLDPNTRQASVIAGPLQGTYMKYLHTTRHGAEYIFTSTSRSTLLVDEYENKHIF